MSDLWLNHSFDSNQMSWAAYWLIDSAVTWGLTKNDSNFSLLNTKSYFMALENLENCPWVMWTAFIYTLWNFYDAFVTFFCDHDFMKNSFLCVFKAKSNGFGMTWEWVNYGEMFIFGWTNPFYRCRHRKNEIKWQDVGKTCIKQSDDWQ